MTVSEMISELQKCPQEAEVKMQVGDQRESASHLRVYTISTADPGKAPQVSQSVVIHKVIYRRTA